MSRPKRRILDSHVHLWPVDTANEDGHSWMPPGMSIAKEQLVADYMSAILTNNDGPDVEVVGLVFIETDVRYDKPSDGLSIWAQGPLDEISFVRSIIEGRYGADASRLIVAIVPWAPIHQPPSVLDEYFQLAEQKAGEETWSKVKGFRYLVQSIVDQEQFRSLVLGQDFLFNLKTLGKRGFSFDVGVDQRSGGSWQLEVMAQAMELAHADVEEDNKIIFVCNAISSMSRLSRTYMKLSGAFSELPSRTTLTKPSDIDARLRPWTTHALRSFGPDRVMFGSDWPVCNLSGPRDEDSWVRWKDVVESILTDPGYELQEDEQNQVWCKATEQAYQLR